MPQVDNNTTAFLAAIRRDAFIATSDTNWGDTRILSIADDCTLKIAGALKRAKQDWFQDDFDLALVSGQGSYDVPEPAMWSSIENAFLRDKTTGKIVSEVNNVSSSNRRMFEGSNVTATGIPTALWLNHSQIVLTPAPDANTVTAFSLTVSAYRRPGQLVLPAECVNVTAVNSVTQTITTTARPSSWVTDTYTSGTPYRVDIYDRLRPNTLLLRDQTVTAPSTTALAFSPSITAARFALIAVGDVVAMKNTSQYPDLPDEGVPFLREMVQQSILTSQTDSQALQVYLAAKAEEAALFIRSMSNRHDGRPKRLSLYNAAGSRFIRRGFMGQR